MSEVPAINNQLTTDEIQALQAQLEELKLEHRDLDDVVQHLIDSAYPDQLQLKRIKKRKLRLKDMIEQIESRLIPDLDA
ncbi:MAG: YdcH family protein [Thiogranum sp.]|nr:YdcH family protein [Thiogranum sp.]